MELKQNQKKIRIPKEKKTCSEKVCDERCS